MRALAFAFLVFFTFAPTALALTSGVDTSGNIQSGVDTGTSVKLINPLNTGAGDCSATNTCLSAFLTNILNFVVNIGTVVVILMLVYVGFLFVVARGVPGKIEEARKALLWTVVGALILLGAKAIAIGIQATVQAISVGK